MASTFPKTVHLSMLFFPPPYGNLSLKDGFLARLPTSDPAENIGTPYTTFRCLFSETTTHTIVKESLLTKISSIKRPFRWVAEKSISLPVDPFSTHPNAPGFQSFTKEQQNSYFFTSALGQSHLEDAHSKAEAITPQLEPLGILDFHFQLEGENRKTDKKHQHYFRLPNALVAKDFFEGQPHMTAAKAKDFEVVLGIDFIQSYPHILIECTPSPACDMIISTSLLSSRLPRVLIDAKGQLEIYTAGVCDEGGEMVSQKTEGGFGVFFAPGSVYNTFRHLPALESGVKDPLYRQDGAAGFGNTPPKTAPSRESAELSAVVLAVGMALMLKRLGYPFNGWKIYTDSSYVLKLELDLCVEIIALGNHWDEGIENRELLERFLSLFKLLLEPKEFDNSTVENFSIQPITKEQNYSAYKMAELGANMWALTGAIRHDSRDSKGPFADLVASFSPVGTRSPSRDGSYAEPESPSTSNTRFNFGHHAESTTLTHQHDLENPQIINIQRSNSGSGRWKFMNRVPMALNTGSNLGHVSEGKLLCLTARGLFLLVKEWAEKCLKEADRVFHSGQDQTQDCQLELDDSDSDTPPHFTGGLKEFQKLKLVTPKTLDGATSDIDEDIDMNDGDGRIRVHVEDTDTGTRVMMRMALNSESVVCEQSLDQLEIESSVLSFETEFE